MLFKQMCAVFPPYVATSFKLHSQLPQIESVEVKHILKFVTVFL